MGVLGVVDEFFEDLEVAIVRIEGGLFLSKLSLDFRDSSNLLLRLSFNKVSLIRALLFDIVAENLLLSIGVVSLRELKQHIGRNMNYVLNSSAIDSDFIIYIAPLCITLRIKT